MVKPYPLFSMLFPIVRSPLFLLNWVLLIAFLANGCSWFVGDKRAQKIWDVREKLYQESRHHRFAVGQISHTFEQSQFRDAIKERFEDDIPTTLGKHLGFEYSINHLYGWLHDVTHYTYKVEGNTGDLFSMSHTNFSSIFNYYLWRAFGSEMAIGAGIGTQFLQRKFVTIDGSQSDTQSRVLGVLQAQYNQVFTRGVALSYTLRTIYIDAYDFDNPSNDDLNKIATRSLRYNPGGVQVIVNYYFPFFTQPEP